MRKSLFWIVGLIAFCCSMPSKTLGYYEDKLYCKLSKDSIVISLSRKDGSLCNTYVRSLELAMKDVYIDILAIQKHIDNDKDDLDYRKALKKTKGDYLNSLQAVRLNILSHMKKFEQELLQQSKTYFMQSISLYKKKLKSALSQLADKQDEKSINYADLVKQQLATIDFLAQSETFEIFAVNLQKYLYLKKQLAGK